ncbi:TetR/AcrR family transcriptional regulator [Fundidesulfovibrio magnetotacticus]|nr:TetR/AcrR family transcriptional regulator [Fundidesulfovibrio magnetotacticus]
MQKDARRAILEAAAPLIHRQGFNNTGLKEILDAARVPKGSFYFYFKSKEDFGIALVDHIAQGLKEDALAFLEANPRPPLEQLRLFMEHRRDQRIQADCEAGCPIGNLALEMSDLSPAMRGRIRQALDGVTRFYATFLRQAQERGELDPALDADATAAFILDAMEGALLRMKVEKSAEPLDRCRAFVFSKLLA